MMQLEVSNGAYNCVWVGVFLLHAGCFAYLLSCVSLLWFAYDPLVVYMVYYIMPPAQAAHFPVYGAIVAFIAALHGVALVRLVVLSAFFGHLTLNAPPDMIWSSLLCLGKASTCRVGACRTPVRTNDVVAATAIVAQRKRKQRRKKSLRRLMANISRRFQRIFGMHSPYFHEVLIGREVIEIAAQAYQAYRCSNIIASTNVIDAYMGTLFLNCWSTPLVHAFFYTRIRHNILLERVTCIAIDGLLNLVTSTIIPVVLFMPYYYAYDPELYGFTLDKFYDNAWFASFVTECQLIFPVTVIDFLSKLTPHVSTLICLLTIVPLIARRSSAINALTVLPASTNKQPQECNEVSSSRSAPSKSLTVINLLIMITGCTLMGLHIDARIYVGMHDIVGCQQKIYPWLSTKFPCMLFEYNCYRHGTSTVQDKDLDGLEPNSLLWLQFTHCDALVIPATIKLFPELVGFMVFNASVVEWGTDAGFSNTQTNLGTLYFVFVNFTAFPDGLHQPLPPMVSDIELSHTNLTMIPSDLHEHWPNLGLLVLEFCQLSEFPESPTKLSIDYFSLFGNNISNVSLLTDMQSLMLNLNFNPVQHLPERYNKAAHMPWLAIENMHLETIPDWLHTDVDMAYLYGNPYCDAITDDEGSVKCFTRDAYADGMLPYEYMRQITPC